jgi:glycosyltransferase involved in cell wall biosynthesis
VTFVNRYFHPDESATSQLLSDLCFGLAQQGFEVRVITSRQRYDHPRARLPRREVIQGVRVQRVWSTRFGRAGLIGRAMDYATFYLSCAAALILHLRCGDTVVAKTDPPLLSIVAMCAARFKGARLVNWLQDIFPEVATQLGANPLPPWLDGRIRRLRDRSLAAARVNVVLGERMRGLLQARGIARSRIAVIENWSDAGDAPPMSAGSSRLRASMDLGSAFIAAYSGNLGRAHEFETLLGAARLLRHDRHIKFLVIGGGAGLAPLKQAVLHEGLDSFRFAGYQPRAALADSLAAADVHLVSLRPALEGLIVPSKFYGILAAGRPAVFVGAADGELAGIIREEGVGLAVTVGDAEALARGLRLLSEDERARHAMGERAHALFRARYSWQRALDAWVDVLDQGRGASPSMAPTLAGGVSTPSLSGR